MSDRENRGYANAGMALSTMFHQMALQAVSRAEVGKPTANPHIFVESDDKHTSLHASEAVILAATALEAGINEIAWWCGIHNEKYMLDDGFKDLSIRDKWRQLPAIAGASFVEGERPWQDFDCLFGLRDCLVHFKWTEPAPKKVMRYLESQNLAMRNKDLGWSIAALTNRTAQWAVATVGQMFARLTVMIGQKGEAPFSWGNPAAFPAWKSGSFSPCPAIHVHPLVSARG